MFDPSTHPPAAAAGVYERADEGGMTLNAVLATLRRHVWLIAAITAVTFGLVAQMVLSARPQYLARAVIRLQDQRQAITGGMSGEAAERVFGAQNDPLRSQVQVLRSRGVASEVARQTGFRLMSADAGLPRAALRDVTVTDAVPETTLSARFYPREYEVRGLGTTSGRLPYGQPAQLPGIRFTVAARPTVELAELTVIDRDDAADRLLAGLRAEPQERTDVVRVEYVAHSPQVAQQVVNATVKAFRDLNARTAQDQARRRRIFAEEQLARTDSLLAEAQTDLTAFRQRGQVFNSQEQVAAEQEGLRGVQMRAQEIDSELRVYRALLTRLRQAPTGRSDRNLRALMANPGLNGNPVVAQLSTQLMRYEMALDSLTAGEWGSAASDPQVQRLTALVSATRTDLIDAVGGQASALEERRASLDVLSSRATAGMRALPVVEAEEARLVQRAETVRDVAQALRQEYQRAQIAEAVEVGQVQVVDLAPLPRSPIGTGKKLKLALGLIMGLMLGCGVAFVREHMNTAIRVDEIERLLGTTAVAVIPPLRERTVTGWVKARPGGGTRRAETEALPELVTISASRSAGAEAFRTLRTNLLFTQGTQSLRTLVVTSAAPGEGKTTVTSNIAAAFAQQGLRVLMLDCDLRRPRLHVPFGLPREPGLTEVVLGFRAEADAAQSTVVEGLSLIAAGTLPPNPAEFVGGRRMEEFLESVAGRYDLVIIDTPPTLAAADASILAAHADGVLLVLRGGRTERMAAQQSMRQLVSVGSRVLGVVYNDPDGQVPRSGGYYYSYSGYYGDTA